MKYADTIIWGASFFPGLGLPSDYDYIAVKEGRILALGRGTGWKEYVAADTKITEFTKDQLVIPGFHDSHLHLLMSALNFTYVDLGSAKSEDEAARMVKDFADTIPQDAWVIGLNWYHMNWEGRQLPTVESLDRYLPDRPVFLTNTEVHGAWVNSKALAVCGVTKDTPNPEHGEIVRFENGEATGFLNEMAMGIAARHALKFDIEKEQELVEKVVKNFAACGVTAIQDMRPELGYDLGQYETFYGMEQEGRLNVRVHSAANLLDDMEEVMEQRKKYNGDKFRICLLKQYMDGVPTTYTAMLVEPYADNPGQRGEPINDIELLRQQVHAAHRNGLSVKIHCCGDRAVRQALDFYESAIERYGDTGARHGVEHIEIVQPEDVERFAKLGIVASMQPEHMVIQVDKYEDNPYFEKYSKKQLDTAWIFRTLLDRGIAVAFGSDCPVVSINPLIGVYRAVTRRFNDGQPEGGMNPDQKISVAEALHCYTYHSAYGVRREHELGTLEAGKYADLAVLDKNILLTDPEEIKNTNVLLTMMDGKVTHRAEMAENA